MHSHIDGKEREQDVLTVALGSFVVSFTCGETGGGETYMNKILR